MVSNEDGIVGVSFVIVEHDVRKWSVLCLYTEGLMMEALLPGRIIYGASCLVAPGGGVLPC